MYHSPVTIAHGLAFPEGPTLSPDGTTLYWVNLEADFISRLDLRAGQLTREWARLPEGGRGNGMTWGPDGALYVADVGRRCVCRLDAQDGVVSRVVDRTDSGEALRGPNDLIFSPHGDLYFTDPQGSWDAPTGAVYRIAAGAETARLVADGLRFPNGLVLSPDGKTLLVAETPLHRITAVTLATGEKRVFAIVSETGGPDGMRWGPDGSLYAAIFGGGEVVRVSLAGEVTNRISVPQGGKPTNLCFSEGGTALYVTEAGSHSVVCFGSPDR